MDNENNLLIMPKQTAQIDAFYASLEIYYKSYINGEIWHSNTDFKEEIKKALPYLASGAQDGAYLVKQSELTRYFGLVEYEYSKPGKAHITDKGIKFYNAYVDKNIEVQIDIIMDSIFNLSFGRNNTAIQSSNSDVDAPKLFLKAINDLGSISTKGLAYLLYVTHNLKINYFDAVLELNKTDNTEREIPIEVSNKYKDVKFTNFLTSIGITKLVNGNYQFSSYIRDKYLSKIQKMSIYNKEPDFTLTLNENIEVDTNKVDISTILVTDIDQDIVITSFAYNVNSEKFKKQNNRIPVSYNRGNTIRYKMNARISKTALDLANYICMGNHNHITFTSKLGKQYMEAHHLIPMMAQKDFVINLDRVENIVSICPICHSAIHFGDTATRLELLKKLFDLKEQELKSVGLNISFGELFAKYYK